MCVERDSLPPLSRDSAVSATGDDLTLTAADGARFGAFAARPRTLTGTGIVILPDLRGLHPFYRTLALRLAGAGYRAVAIDYYGRTAGAGERAEDFPFME